METFSALLAFCAGNSPVIGEFPAHRPVTRNFDVFSDLRPNKRLRKQWWCWWFQTPLRPLWHHCKEDVGVWAEDFRQMTIFFKIFGVGAESWCISLTSYERHDVSNHRHVCVSLFGLKTKKSPMLYLPMDSSNKVQVTRSTCHDVYTGEERGTRLSYVVTATIIKVPRTYRTTSTEAKWFHSCYAEYSVQESAGMIINKDELALIKRSIPQLGC